MELSKEEYIKLTPYLQLIETTVRNQSASNLSIEFLTVINEIAKTHHLSNCQTCQRQLYIAITRIYDSYLDYRIQHKNKVKRK